MLDDPEPAGIRLAGMGAFRRSGEVRRCRVQAVANLTVFDAGREMAVYAHGVVIARASTDPGGICQIGRCDDVGGPAHDRLFTSPRDEAVNGWAVGCIGRHVYHTRLKQDGHRCEAKNKGAGCAEQDFLHGNRFNSRRADCPVNGITVS
ncbi:hypothetical protein PROAA_290067 [Candidatus Propionivibrio aalborgensis]|uniref:Uncharacterized protein n=1 Tax=Candidatus Propionivibrio aalborgensis TaxID=1860101 RepID=A0A1A8XXN6_9RHOO|nr:hypothetical protein PROAA_290067 [Candidatus Propionivibrio aalborgensis]